MKKLNLKIRYIIVFIIACTFTAIIINKYKQEKIKEILFDYSSKISKSYDSVYLKHKQISKLIFFNNILFDEKIVQNLKNNKKDELYYYLRRKYFYLKSYGLSNIKFYKNSNELFLDMLNPKKEAYISSNKSLDLVAKNLDDVDYIDYENRKLTLNFIKPIFDDKLNHIGSIELEFSIENFLLEMERNLDFNIFFVSKNIDEFVFNKTSIFSKYKYNKKIFDFFEKKNILEKLFNNKISLKTFNFEGHAYPLIVHPLEKDIYLLSFGSSKDTMINLRTKNLNILMYSLFIIYMVMLFEFLKYINLKSNFLMLDRKHKDYLKAINKYVIMIETDKKGVITDVTRPYCKLSGYTKDEFIGKNVNILRNKDISKEFFKRMWEKLKVEKTWEGEIKNTDKYGNSYWIKGVIFPRYDKDNNHVGFTSIRVNITDEVQLRKLNRFLKDELSSKLNELKLKEKTFINNSKENFFAKVLDTSSSQWKKPISQISIELTKLKALSKKKSINTNDIEIINENISNNLKVLSISLNEFKSFFKDENSDKYNVTVAIKSALLEVKKQKEYKNININISSREEIFCFGSYEEIKFIMINLFRNSLEQIKKNSIKEPYIKVELLNDKDDVLIKYIDNSKSCELASKILSSSCENELKKNMGLNLYMSKLLIDKSGSNIFMSENNNETVFYIKLISKDRREYKRL